MKKIISCVLVLALFLSLGLSGVWSGRAMAEVPKDRVGSYVLTGLVMNGEDYTDRIQGLSLVFTLELKADGTGVLVRGDEKQELSWDEESISTDDGILLPYTFEDGVLVIEDELAVMTFTKRDPEELLPAEKEDPGIVGVWEGTLDIKEFLGELVPELGEQLESAPVNASLEVREDGGYTLTLDAAPLLPSLRDAMLAVYRQMGEESELSQEQLEESFGMSLEEKAEETIRSLELEALNRTVEGVYELAGDDVTWDKGPQETHGSYTGDKLVFSLHRFGDVELSRAEVYGIWTAETELEALIGKRDESLEELPEDFKVGLTLELRSDESFVMTVDADALLPALRSAMSGYFEKAAKESGFTVEEYEEMTGKSLEEAVDEAFEKMHPEQLAEPISGSFERKDDTLILKAENGSEETGTLRGKELIYGTEGGEIRFSHVIFEDVLAKGEGVMDYAAYEAAKTGEPVVIEAYVMDCQTWDEEGLSVYAQDADGAYFIYKMTCSEEEAAELSPGRKIRVSGVKTEWSGEFEISDASFEILKGSYSFRPFDATAYWGSPDLIGFQNRLVSFRELTVEEYKDKEGVPTGAAFAYQDPENKTGDLYFQVTFADASYEFVVETDLCGSDSEIYRAVEGLHVGDVIDLEGYLFWYHGPNLHTIALNLRQAAEK